MATPAKKTTSSKGVADKTTSPRSEGSEEQEVVEEGVGAVPPPDSPDDSAPEVEPEGADVSAFHVTDPEPMSEEASAEAPVFAQPMVTVVVMKNEASVLVGEAHYSLRAGTTLTVQQPVADELVNRKLARAL